MWRRLSIASLVLLAVACASGEALTPSATSSSPPGTASPSAGSVPATPSPTKTKDGEPAPDTEPRFRRFPAPDARLPHRSRRVAEQLLATHGDLKELIGAWKRREVSRLRVALGGLWQQRLYRKVIRDEVLHRRVIKRVPAWFRRIVNAHVEAGRKLSRLVTPIKPRDIHFPTTTPEHPDRLRRLYSAAQRRFGVPWHVLASVNFVETRFGRLKGPSSAGALGPMQFMPGTWDMYGRGDIMDPRDAIMAAGRYLAASGAPGNMRSALYAYNHSFDYVDAIQIYARQIRRDPRQFVAYYFWQVFIATTKGDLQWTGPGTGR